MFPALLLLTSVIVLRIAPSLGGPEAVRALAGWSPLMALSLCAGAFFPRRHAVIAGLAAVLIPHVAINLLQGYPLWGSYLPALAAAVVVVSVLGAAAGKKASVAVFAGASVLSTVLFHLVSNTVSFFAEPAYAPDFGGWVQCQTVGLPGFPPTWLFTLKQLAGDLLFTLAFLFACRPVLTRNAPAIAVPTPVAATPSVSV